MHTLFVLRPYCSLLYFTLALLKAKQPHFFFFSQDKKGREGEEVKEGRAGGGFRRIMFRRCAGLLGPLARTSPVQRARGVGSGGGSGAAGAEADAPTDGPTAAQEKLGAETQSLVYSATPAEGMDIDVQHVVKGKQMKDGVRRAFEDEAAPTAAEVAAANAAKAAKAERRVGRVVYWNYERGWGKLIDVANNREIMVHSRDVEGQVWCCFLLCCLLLSFLPTLSYLHATQASHRRGLQVHQTVEYTVGGTSAVDVTQVGGGQPRPAPRHGTRHAAGYGNLY